MENMVFEQKTVLTSKGEVTGSEDLYNAFTYKGKYCNHNSEKLWDEECKDVSFEIVHGSRWREIKDFYFKLRKMLEENDKEAIADSILYPLEFSVFHDYPDAYRAFRFKDKKTFLKYYNRVFPKKIRDDILKDSYKDLIDIGVTESINLISNISFYLKCADIKEDEKTCKDYNIGIKRVTHRFDK
ncbi:hypothetical protein I862_00800 [endosymbiont of Acanthamoeba sp. UWC8]|nr:hypothetical protein I862_00800 [endosymbiont of Acanthamoeba sp. UWC8]